MLDDERVLAKIENGEYEVGFISGDVEHAVRESANERPSNGVINERMDQGTLANDRENLLDLVEEGVPEVGPPIA